MRPFDWTGVRAIRERENAAKAITQAMDVMFPYRDWRDDPDKVRGDAQRIIEKALHNSV